MVFLGATKGSKKKAATGLKLRSNRCLIWLLGLRGRYAQYPPFDTSAVDRSNPTLHLTPQNDQLMLEHRILSFKPALRLEWRG